MTIQRMKAVLRQVCCVTATAKNTHANPIIFLPADISQSVNMSPFIVGMRV
jgi:hypothetical protein